MAVGTGAKFEGLDAHLEQRRRLPGPVGDGRYEFVAPIGEGRHKRVYRAFDCHVGREVALALIKAEAFGDLGEARVWREAESMQRLSGHPNTVAFTTTAERIATGRPYLVTEHIESGDLCEWQAAAPRESIPLAEVLRIARDVASALAHVHAHGIVHRDVKPENVWITNSGVAKLGDFGLSLPSGECQPGCGATIEGTPAYMPPEQALGGPTDERADLYSLGDAAWYELLCAQPPFVAERPGAQSSGHTCLSVRSRPRADGSTCRWRSTHWCYRCSRSPRPTGRAAPGQGALESAGRHASERAGRGADAAARKTGERAGAADGGGVGAGS